MQQINSTDILWRALTIFLLIGALTGVAVSLLMIFNPGLLDRVNRVANRWVSMRFISRWMDRSFRTERWFYRHHRKLGPLLVLGAGYMLLYFGWLLDQAAALRSLKAYLPDQRLAETLLHATVLLALVGGTLALLIGVVYWIRPSLLKGFEAGSNRWLSLRRATKAVDVTHSHVNQFVERHARKVGWLLLLASISLLVLMLRALAYFYARQA